MKLLPFLLLPLIGFALTSSCKRRVSPPTAVLHLEAGRKLSLLLYVEKAPNTVASFVSLARKGFYNGLIFHRVVPGFVVQGGDPLGTGEGGPGYSLKAEFNDIPYDEGVLGMARTQDPDSAGSQFFITLSRKAYLDGQYIASLPRDSQHRPEKPPKILDIQILPEGLELPQPQTIVPPRE